MVRKLTLTIAHTKSEKATALHGIGKFFSESSGANSMTQQIVFAQIVPVNSWCLKKAPAEDAGASF